MTQIEIEYLREKILIADRFINVYKGRLHELEQAREQMMKELVEKQMTPIIEA